MSRARAACRGRMATDYPYKNDTVGRKLRRDHQIVGYMLGQQPTAGHEVSTKLKNPTGNSTAAFTIRAHFGRWGTHRRVPPHHPRGIYREINSNCMAER